MHCPSSFDGELAHVFMSTGEDGLVKIWDRRSAQAVASVTTPNRAPLFSISSNQNLIVGGTNEDLFMWDIHALTKPIAHFVECHSEDVTGIAFSKDQSQFVTCGIDYVLNFFNLSLSTAKKGFKEDEVIDGAYSCLQPMVTCGYVTDEIIWA